MRFRALLAPAALFLGLALFGVSLLGLAAIATRPTQDALQPARVVVVNGTAVMTYPTGFFGYPNERIDVEFAFPQAPGNAYFLACFDEQRVLAGGAPDAPLLEFSNLKSSSFKVDDQTVNVYDFYRTKPTVRDCYTNSLVFTWAAPDGDPAKNQPAVHAVSTYVELTPGVAATLLMLSVGGALLSLVGGLLWARERGVALPPEGQGTAEALRGALDRMGEQLERTRRHLLFAGVLGIFLWYPILVPWVWRSASAATNDPLIPWAVAGGALAFLVVLTVLWAREFVRLDREVRAWRSRLGELRVKEESLLDSLESREE